MVATTLAPAGSFRRRGIRSPNDNPPFSTRSIPPRRVSKSRIRSGFAEYNEELVH